MGLFKNAETPCTAEELAVASWFRSGCSGIIWTKVDIPSAFRLINCCVWIPVGETRMFWEQRVNEFYIGSVCNLINDTLQHLCDPRHCHHQAWFKGWCKRWMPLQWCWLDLYGAVGHWMLSLQCIPLPLFTDNAGKVRQCHIHPLVKVIPRQNRQR